MCGGRCGCGASRPPWPPRSGRAPRRWRPRSGSGASGGSCDRSCSQAKKRMNGPAPAAVVVADGAAQHRVAGLQRVEDRALRDRARDLQFHLAADARQRRAGAPAAPPGSWQRLDLDRQHRGQIADDRRPVVPGIGRRVHLAAGRAEVDAARRPASPRPSRHAAR